MSLDAVLAKSEAWAKEQAVQEATLLGAKLADDMFPLKRQVQVACDMAKRAIAASGGRAAGQARFLGKIQ